MNKLLLITYNFPPINSAGVFRVANFARLLSARDWDVTVLTVRGSSTEALDPGLMELVPGSVRVIRTACPEFNRLARRVKSPPVPHPAETAGVGAVDAPRRGRRGPVGALARLVRRVLTFPDQQVGWYLPLLWNAARIVRRDRIRYVMTSSPPHSSHLPMLVLRRLFRLRWVADFRDPWTAPRRVAPGWPWLEMQRLLERRVLTTADAVVANTEGNRRVLLESFPKLKPERVVVITNGFDVARFERVLSASRPDAAPAGPDVDLVYTGSVYPGMIDPYLAALEVLRSSGRALPRLRVYGMFETPEEEAKIRAGGFGDVVDYRGRVSYDESVRVIANAPALLLLLPSEERHAHWVPSKLYPYLFSGRPILAIVPRGDAARIVTETGTGMTAPAANASEVADTIAEFLERNRRGEMAARRNPDAIDAFRVERLVDRLDDVLRSLPA